MTYLYIHNCHDDVFRVEHIVKTDYAAQDDRSGRGARTGQKRLPYIL
jgi:hypothetical protein